jgi:hypothetical protein
MSRFFCSLALLSAPARPRRHRAAYKHLGKTPPADLQEKFCKRLKWYNLHMAGHSKWAKLKHTKGKTDAQKSKLFSKLVRFITLKLKKAKATETRRACALRLKKQRRQTCPPTISSAHLAKGSEGKSSSRSCTKHTARAAAHLLSKATPTRATAHRKN